MGKYWGEEKIMSLYSFLPEDEIQKIQSSFPIINNWINYNILSIVINDSTRGTEIGSALVCLDDARLRYSFLETALLETKIKIAYFREYSQDNPNEKQAIASGVFFLTYATLLLYAIGEDISFFIIHYFGYSQDLTDFIKRGEVKKSVEKKKISSNQAKLALFLKEEKGKEEITKIVCKLNSDANWKKALCYRNDWVHQQPPIIKGLEYSFPRKMFTTSKDENGYKTIYLKGMSPQLNLDQFVEIVYKATKALHNSISEINNLVLSENLGA